MALDAVEFIRRFLLHVLPQASSRSATSDCSPTATAARPSPCAGAISAPSAPDISPLLTELQKSALNRSCPQCKHGTLHVVARQLFDATGISCSPLACANFDSS